MKKDKEEDMQKLMHALANWIFVSTQLDMVDKVIQYANEYYDEILDICEEYDVTTAEALADVQEIVTEWQEAGVVE